MKRYFIYCVFAVVFIFAGPVLGQDEPMQALAEQELGPGEVIHIFQTVEKESDYYDCLDWEDNIVPNENSIGELYWLKIPTGLDKTLINNNLFIAANPIDQLQIISAIFVHPATIYEENKIEVQFKVYNTDYEYWSNETYIDVYVSLDHDFNPRNDWYVGSAYLRKIPPGESDYSDMLVFCMPYVCGHSVKIAALLDEIMYLPSDSLWINCEPASHSHSSRSHGCFVNTAK